MTATTARPSTTAFQLEPPRLARHFLDFPPENFEAFLSDQCVPGFRTRFDLLTTADPDTRRLFESLPGHRLLRSCLAPRTWFFGTTVSEYAPLPATQAPAALVDHLLRTWNRKSLLMIVKDIPADAQLLSECDHRHAMQLLDAFRERGFVIVEGQALAYVPIDFADEEEYLSRLSAGRRRDIRRKLRMRARLQVESLATGSGALLEEPLVHELYTLYQQVYAQSEIHFDRLTLDFFRAVFGDAELNGQVFLYRAQDKLIGFNLCFIHGGMLIDKYVGFRYPDAREYNLYFLSWMQNLEFARRHGLTRYVAGWTDPEIKTYLGASFTFTRHAVFVRNPILRAVLRRFSGRFESDRAWFDAHAQSADS